MTSSDSYATTTYAELIELVLDAEIAWRLGRTPTRAEMLEALAARAELIDRFTRWRWLAIEDARRAGASWPEVDAAVGASRPGTARAEYEAKLRLQKELGLVSQDRCDPGRSEAPTRPLTLSHQPSERQPRGRVR